MELPIVSHKLVWTPLTSSGVEGYRWKVELAGYGPVLVDLSDTQATMTGLSTTELTDRLPVALQQHAAGRREGGDDALEQLGGWDVPIVLTADDFRA